MDTAQHSRFAAEFDADVSSERIAEVYAAAFLNACAAKGASLSEATEEFASFIAVLKAQPKFAEVLASEMVAVEEKLVLLEKTISAEASPLFWNFLQTIARRGRLALLKIIYRKVSDDLDIREARIPVTVTTATEMDAQLLAGLTEKLKEIVRGKPIITSVVNPELLGGLVVRVGDTVYDASIFTQLKNVRQQMIDRSAAEIQSKRETFFQS